MSKYTAQDLETLRRQAQEIEKVLAAEKAAREQAYASQKAALEKQRENDLRQAYIRQQQTLMQLPEQLAAAGINGGPAESSLIRLNRDYGSQRAEIGREYGQAYRDLQAKKAADDAEAAAKAAQNRIDYMGAEAALRAQLAEQAAAQQQTAVSHTGGTAPERAPKANQTPEAQPRRPRPSRANDRLVGHVQMIR